MLRLRYFYYLYLGAGVSIEDRTFFSCYFEFFLCRFGGLVLRERNRRFLGKFYGLNFYIFVLGRNL